MKKILKWVAIILGPLLVIGFLCFLYLIPPFTLVPPETFSKPEGEAGPALDDISDPATKLVAQHGKYLVTAMGCAGCHTSVGDQGPQWDKYLAGGMKFESKEYGTLVSRNLTPDPQTGLARRSDEYVTRVLQSGVLDNGRISTPMPWYAYSNLTMEDMHAVVTYLRHLKSVKHDIPDPQPKLMPKDRQMIEGVYGADYAKK